MVDDAADRIRRLKSSTSAGVSNFAAPFVGEDGGDDGKLAGKAVGLAVRRVFDPTLTKNQHPDGYWCGDLIGDSTLESDYILLQMWLYPPAPDGSWDPPTVPKIRKAVRAILEAQRDDGGWNTYEPGQSEINATVRAYAMLKLTEKYSEKPAAELPMLFQRILQNTIHDHFRRQKVRSTWTTLLSAFGCATARRW